MTVRQNRHRYALALLLLGFVSIYARATSYSFVWDDIDNINNPLLDGPWLDGLHGSQHDYLDSAYRRIEGMRPAHDSYRPVLYASHRLERLLYGRSAAGHHAHNIALALLVVLLVYVLARRWLEDETQSLLVAAIFALHPVQVEPIVYVSGRGDLLAAFFTLVALLCALSGGQNAASTTSRYGWAGLSALAYLLALLSKESYIGAPVALALIAWSQGRLRAHAVDFAVQVVALAAYFALRTSMARTAGGTASVDGILYLPGLWLQYVGIALMPTDLSIVRPYARAARVAGWLALGATCLVAALACRKAPLAPRLALRRIAAGLLLALVFIGPSAVVVRIMGVVADRYLYLPMVGFAVALVATGDALMHRFAGARRLIPVMAAALGAIWAVITVLQVPVWRNASTLYSHAVAIEPTSAKAVYGLGLARARAGECGTALPLFERAVALDPGFERAWNNLSVCAMQEGNLDLALRAATRASILPSPTGFRALYNLGCVYLRLGHTRQACDALRRSRKVNPSYIEARDLYYRVCSELR